MSQEGGGGTQGTTPRDKKVGEEPDLLVVVPPLISPPSLVKSELRTEVNGSFSYSIGGELGP